MKKHWILWLILFLCASLSTKAQNPYIQHYTTFDGLPSNSVYHVIQDSRNFIWFATDAGVVRYDGTQYTCFQKKDGLSSNEIVRIMEDSRGKIWFFNLNGKFNYFFQNKIFNESNSPILDSLNGNSLFRNSFEDSEKTLYFFHNYKGDILTLDSLNRVYRYNMGKVHTQGPKSIVEAPMVIRNISRNDKGEFLIWALTGIYRCKKLTDKPVLVCDTFVIRRVIQGFNNQSVIDGCRKLDNPYDKVQSILYYFNGEKLTKVFPIPLISDIPVSSILEDHLGYLWIPTFDHGVICMKDNRIVLNLDIKQAQSIIQDNENNIWITSMKDGVYKISPYINSNKHFGNSLFENQSLSALAASPSGGIWCTNGNLIYLIKDGIHYSLAINDNENYFNHLFQLQNGTLVAGERSADYVAIPDATSNIMAKGINYPRHIKSGVHYKRLLANNTEDEVCSFNQHGFEIWSNAAIFKESKGNVIVGERVFNTFYNLKNELIINANKNYIYSNKKLNIAKNLTRFTGKIITDHLILNATTELYNLEGDSIFVEHENQFYNLTSAFSDPVDLQIKRIIFHGTTLYLATARNIYVCENPLEVIHNKTVYLQPIDISFRNINDIIFKDSSLYIATDDGLSIIPAASYKHAKSTTPIPYFQSIQLNEKEIDYHSKQIEIVGNNRLKFQFSSINYSGQPVIYAYMLEGEDTSWTSDKLGIVVYQNLPRGVYRFKLKVRKPTSGWSNPIVINIRVRAPFWQHPLFVIFLFLALGALITLVIIRRKNLQIRKREIDHQLITLEQQALQAMMNPHFIFNALGSIQNYLLQNKAAEAALYLAQFARLIRQNLNAITSASINLEDEVDRLKNYLDLENLRMENKFDYVIEIDEEVEEESVFIPSMIIQPFVENSIWHGISALAGRGNICLSFRMQTEDSLLIILEDNGIGIAQSKEFANKEENHLKIGIGMTRKRLDILGKKFNVETRIEFMERDPGIANPGTRVEIIVPVTYNA